MANYQPFSPDYSGIRNDPDEALAMVVMPGTAAIRELSLNVGVGDFEKT